MDQSDLQLFFILRMQELFNKNSIDSYRVRSNNVMSLLHELRYVVIGWKSNRIKTGDTVKLCIDETIEAIKEDSCMNFSNCSKKMIITELEDFKKNNTDEHIKDARNQTKADHLLFYVNPIISANDESYLDAIMNNLKILLFDNGVISTNDFIPKFGEIDKMVTSLSAELLRKGFSKIYLYKYFTNDILKCYNSKPFDKIFAEIYDKFCNRKRTDFTTIFIIPFNSDMKFDKKGVLFPEFVDKVPMEYIKATNKDKIKSMSITSNKYFINNVEALDQISAVKLSREKLSTILDTRPLGANNINITIPYSAMVYQNLNGTMHGQYVVTYSLDGSRLKDVRGPLQLINAIHKIMENNSVVDNSCQDRIGSALRHLRIGDMQTEIEQKFINYWVGLEFLFSSPETTDSTYTRLKEHLITLMSCCYVRRNRENLNNLLIAKKKLNTGDIYWQKSDLDDYINNMSDILMRYRLKKMKSNLHSRESKENYIKKHKINLHQHISRLYRLRNELIHEAAIKQNIENTTSDLRYYLVFVLNQVINFFSEENVSEFRCNMNSFFWYYECQWKRINESNYDINILMSIPYNDTLIK